MLAYWRDVVSDLSRFHRIRRVEDADGLDAPGFLALTHRLDVYGGAVALRVAQHRARRDTPPPVREMTFDEWVGSHQQLVIAAASGTGGEGHA